MDRTSEVFKDGGTKETITYKDAQGHVTNSNVEQKFADGRTETRSHYETKLQDGTRSLDATKTTEPNGNHAEHYESKTDGKTTSTTDVKTWKDADGNSRRDVSDDNKEAKAGEISHQETHEVTYNKDSADGKHKAGDHESSTLTVIKN
ncbi:hypothetical protein [Streptomyces avermitilis]|uniref:hypothetical protein n=1 Tax=Streptomyces avermitilis TaxID=33903 RepID=UPI0033D466E8